MAMTVGELRDKLEGRPSDADVLVEIDRGEEGTDQVEATDADFFAGSLVITAE